MPEVRQGSVRRREVLRLLRRRARPRPPPRPLRAPARFRRRTGPRLQGPCTVLYAGSGEMDVRRVGRLVAEAVQRPLPDVTRELRNSRGFIAKGLPAPVAVALAEKAEARTFRAGAGPRRRGLRRAPAGHADARHDGGRRRDPLRGVHVGPDGAHRGALGRGLPHFLRPPRNRARRRSARGIQLGRAQPDDAAGHGEAARIPD